METKGRRTSLNKTGSETKDGNYSSASRKSTADCGVSKSSSHTILMSKVKHGSEFERNPKDFSTESSESYGCVHGPEGKKYSKSVTLEKKLTKYLDPLNLGRVKTEDCLPSYDWDMAKKLEFLVKDSTVNEQIERLQVHVRDFGKITRNGFRIDNLDSVCVILDYLVDSIPTQPSLREGLHQLLQNIGQPIVLNAASDAVKYFSNIRNYVGFLGYLLITLEDDELFDIASRGIIWQLSTPDRLRKQYALKLRHVLAASVPVLFNTTIRMVAIAKSSRFDTFLHMALLLAYDTADNCIDMMKDNIIESVFYRFNPYFPERQLPTYDINPAEPVNDCNVRSGDSGVHLSKTLSLLLLLLKTTIRRLDECPSFKDALPCPDNYAQRCFIWAYRFICRAKEHRYERIIMTVIATALLRCFGERMQEFSSHLMPDIMSMSVMSEVPPRKDWTATVNINTSQIDVHFKKTLMYLSVAHLKVFQFDRFFVEDRHWLIGLMYLLDPGLSPLRAKWSSALFAELRKTTLQVLVCCMPLIPPALAEQCGLIQRIMWYIEWYSESPYDLQTLYWCVRLLQVATYNRRKNKKARETSLRELLETHGIIILIRLCYTLLEQKEPLIEKSQVIISVCLRLLTSSAEAEGRISCCVYPTIKWPSSITTVSEKMLDVVLHSLRKHLIICDRLLISLLNFIWETVIWKNEYRKNFVINDGVYKLLDIVTMTRAPVQCIALAVICDVACAGEAVGQLVSWRANNCASSAYPGLVKRGATIAGLLAAIFRDDCQKTGVVLDENGVIQDTDNPLMSREVCQELKTPVAREAQSTNNPVCLPAGDLAGSRMSKAYALLQILSEDLKEKVSVADESYNLYKNVKLKATDEVILVVCSHFLTLKLAEVWTETSLRLPKLLPHDDELLQEFLHIGKGWVTEIKTQQKNVLEDFRKKDLEEERSLYEFLGRVRLNIALDALHEVRCVARSADRNALVHAMIHDAVRAHHRRCLKRKALDKIILRTYKPMLDDQNVTGHSIKVISIHPKDKKPLDLLSDASGTVIYDPDE